MFVKEDWVPFSQTPAICLTLCFNNVLAEGQAGH